MSRVASRVRVVPRAAAQRFLRGRRRPRTPKRILIAHHLLAGDVLMLAPLLAKLTERYPDAQLAMTVRSGLLALFAGRPYGVEPIRYDPHDAATLNRLFDASGYDLALVPGDNRYSWLAAAAGARWIVAFAGDRPAYKSWPVDEERPFPAAPAAWGDFVAGLVDGPAPAPYRQGDWPDPPAAHFERPAGRYAVLHVEASTPLKHWEERKWIALAHALAAKGVTPVWSAGPSGEDYVRRIDPGNAFAAVGHRLDLAQLWQLVAGAALLVCPDTSVAHIGKLTFAPTVCLFGPSSARLFGKGEFWRDAPFQEVTVPEFACRDQQTLFKRRVEWVRRCQRSTAECAEPRCMHAIGVEQVLSAAAALGVYAR